LRPAVVGWYRAVYGRKGCGARGEQRAGASEGGGRWTGGVKRVRQCCRGNRRAEGHGEGEGGREGERGRKREREREKERERKDRGER